MKRLSLFMLALMLILGLAACNGGSSEAPGGVQPDPNGGDDEDGITMEIPVELHYHGTKENDSGEILGVHVMNVWYDLRMEYLVVEYLGDYENVVFRQEGTIDRPEDIDHFTIVREADADGLMEEGEAIMEFTYDGDDLTYKVTWADDEDSFELGPLYYEDALELMGI